MTVESLAKLFLKNKNKKKFAISSEGTLQLKNPDEENKLLCLPKKSPNNNHILLRVKANTIK